jgi:Na+/H+-dicarboxylate symporter
MMSVNSFKNLCKSLPFQLVISIICAAVLGNVLSSYHVSLFYSLSTTIVECLLLILPLMVFIYITAAILTLDHRSPIILAIILLAVTFSNSFSLLVAFAVGKVFLPFISLPSNGELSLATTNVIKPLFSLCCKSPIETDSALWIGSALGILGTFLPARWKIRTLCQNASVKARDLITLFLQYTFIPVLPLYVFGYSLKLSYEGSLVFLVHNYAHVFFLSMGLLVVYSFLQYLIAAKGNFSKLMLFLENMLPAGLTGFTTMSSAATMPVTIQSTEKNIQDKDFADLVIPATANIHMIGDNLTIILTAFSLMMMSLPDFYAFIPFIGAFCIAKLSCVGVPAASVLVVLPVLQQYLNFTPAMISMVTTIYILQDSFGTCGNVMGNGSFAIILKNVYDSIRKKFEQ